jgi:hypothetical protein
MPESNVERLQFPERLLWARGPDSQLVRVKMRIDGTSASSVLPGWVDVSLRVDPLSDVLLQYTRRPGEDEFTTVLALMRLSESCLIGFTRKGWTFFRDPAGVEPYVPREWYRRRRRLRGHLVINLCGLRFRL